MKNENQFVSVALPGPWWTELTYRMPSGELCPVGARVRVPVGSGSRTALVLRTGDELACAYRGEIRDITDIIDQTPILAKSALSLLTWFADAYLCGVGTAAKTLLPSHFMKGEALSMGRQRADKALLPQSELPCRAAEADEVSFVYEPDDTVRYRAYIDMLMDGVPTLIVFPVHSASEAFASEAEKSLPGNIREQLLRFPRSTPAAEWRTWSRLLMTDEVSVVIGGQNSAMAPLRRVARIIVDDESNNIWRTMRHPCYNVRSLLSMRARLDGASLVLGGRMPSARAFMRLDEATREKYKRRKKIFFVDMKLAYSPAISGVTDTLAVSEPLVRETNAAIEKGRWAIWILDRHGYAREIICEECGASVHCRKCGATARWEASSDSVRCNACGASAPAPEECPTCRGRLLSAKRPGLEALFAPARAAIYSDVSVISHASAEEDIEKLSPGDHPGLILGTRAALALCDKLDIGVIGWIDADGEARASRHDARVRAFGLIWESCWRGISPEERGVIVQSRRAGRDWQRGLSEGWGSFWRSEIEERRLFGMPPFVTLISIEANRADTEMISKKLDGCDAFEYWVSDEEDGKGSIIWVRTKRLSVLRSTLEPFFDIKKTRRGIPRITVWHD